MQAFDSARRAPMKDMVQTFVLPKTDRARIAVSMEEIREAIEATVEALA